MVTGARCFPILEMKRVILVKSTVTVEDEGGGGKKSKKAGKAATRVLPVKFLPSHHLPGSAKELDM